jgi:predicted protein tyrosine phosphatase
LNILFVCGKNRLRSPTAEQVFAGRDGVETASAGVSHDADEPVTPELLAWADLVVVMERAHRHKLTARHPAALRGKHVVSLDIPDEYDFMDPALVRLLEARMARHLP